MKHPFVLRNALAATLALTGAAHACSCLAPPAPKIALQQSTAVFAGKVASIRADKRINAVTFNVSKSWKGVTAKTVLVTTANNSAACGIGFQEGEEYLVYARKLEGATTLSTNLCTRTKTLASAADEVTELGAPQNTAQTDAPLPDAPLPDAPLPDAPLPDAPTASEIDSVAPLVELVHALANNASLEPVRSNWKFGANDSGAGTLLYDPRAETLKFYTKSVEPAQIRVQHAIYRGVSKPMIAKLAYSPTSDTPVQSAQQLFDQLIPEGATKTDLGSKTVAR